MTDIAKQYALAVFSLAIEQNKIEEFATGYKSFMDGATKEAEKFFAHPKITKMQKKELIDNTIKDKLLADFLKVVIDNDRFELVESIYYAFLDLVNNMNKIMEIKVFTNKKLKSDNLEKIKTKLGKSYQREIKVNEIIDEKIIGGIRIEYEGKVIDNTVNRYLQNLKSALKE